MQTMLWHCILLHYCLSLQWIGYSFVPPVHSYKIYAFKGLFWPSEILLKAAMPVSF